MKEPQVFLEHILESILLIKQYTENLTKEEFVLSLQIQDAVIRRLEIIGEAVKCLPVELRDTHPNYSMAANCRYERYLNS